MAQDHLLQADAGAEAQRARAQPADRAGRELEHAHPLAVHAQLGVDRSLAQPQRARRPRGNRLDLGQDGGRAAATASRTASPRSRAPRAGRACRTPPAPPDGPRAAAPRPPPPRRAGSSPAAAARPAAARRRPGCPGRARRPSAPASGSSARITPRLPDSDSGLTTQGRPTSRATAATSAPSGSKREARLRDAGLRERPAHRRLVARAGDGGRRVVGQPEALGAQRGGHHALVIDAHDRGERGLAGRARRSARPRLPGPTGAG